MEITMEIGSERDLNQTLKNLSREHGGAWVFSVAPFSHTVTFERYKNPSSVPDYFIDLTQNKIGYKSKVVGFTKAARRREQNRGIGRA